MATLHILVGMPGSGKTTFAKDLLTRLPEALLISYDVIREHMYGDASIQGNFVAINAKAMGIADYAIANKLDVVIDNTNCKASYIEQWIAAFPGYKAIAYVFNCSKEQAMLNQQTRERQVPFSVIESMYANLQKIDFKALPLHGVIYK